MGLVAQCDGGCGASTTDVSTFTKFGVIRKVYYCDKCKKVLQGLYDDRDESHTAYAELLKGELLAELMDFRLANPDARLPDAPE